MAELASAPPAPEDPFDGTPYRLIRTLARGGMGQVFLVEHRRLGRQFVTKLLHDKLASDPQLLDRFRIEAQSLGRLRHPRIVSIFGFETTRDNRPFLVTEYLQGQTIAQELASGTVFSVREAVHYARELLSALAAAHELGIVHRDIKPQNLMLHELPDGTKHIKVLDFGLARVIPGVSPRAPQPLNVPTDTGVIFGTPHFVSPEAALGQHVDHRADLYGVGLVLYTMLARRGPFDHTTSHVGAMAAHLTEEPEAVSNHSPVPIPHELDAIVLKALRKNRDERIQTAQEFETLLASVTKGLDSGRISSIGLTATSNDASAPVEQPAASNEAGSSLPLATADKLDSNTKRTSRLFYVGLTLFAALLVFIVGYLVLAKRGAL